MNRAHTLLVTLGADKSIRLKLKIGLLSAWGLSESPSLETCALNLTPIPLKLLYPSFHKSLAEACRTIKESQGWSSASVNCCSSIEVNRGSAEDLPPGLEFGYPDISSWHSVSLRCQWLHWRAFPKGTEIQSTRERGFGFVLLFLVQGIFLIKLYI